jgi:hypothetical protein
MLFCNSYNSVGGKSTPHTISNEKQATECFVFTKNSDLAQLHY